MAATAPAAATVPDCPLCDGDGGAMVWRGPKLRVIRAQEAGFPAFYRVVWNAHAAEFTDLDAGDRLHCMEAVAAVETALRAHVQPDKINLAALGNMVPHLHWHVIARFAWDSHFPGAVWATPQRDRAPEREAEVAARLAAAEAAMAARLAQLA
ncbi:HIT family protein [Acidovorax sp. SUPP2539]|uniref:HIT family protein n=1 Tax=Acidovorax sp. SUPP2539 TaxID=2920878 RepID=UPI0023DE4056|nr:HIT family protein [Acidovorax sp. SUPP2539]GKS88158.1 HIT family protein [Acidovorax sp. SUPP2539]